MILCARTPSRATSTFTSASTSEGLVLSSSRIYGQCVGVALGRSDSGNRCRGHCICESGSDECVVRRAWRIWWLRLFLDSVNVVNGETEKVQLC